MKVKYISCLYGENIRKLYKKQPGQQVQIFNNLIVEGLIMNKINVECKSVVPISKELIDCILLNPPKDKNISYFYIINIPVLKDLIIIVKSFLLSIYDIFKNNDIVFLCDVLSTTNALGTVLACKLLRKDFVGIVTDLPDHLDSPKLFVKLTYFIINNCTKYVFLTESMNTLLNKHNKPYTVVEGMCQKLPDVEKKRNHNIIYAGSLDRIYGIENLVNAFLKLDTDYELHIYGEGDFEKELSQITKNTNKINYYGCVSHEVVLKEIQQASFLINPRPTDKELVKYSFPSKTLEYLASGTPFISTKLPCYLEEYDEYINYLDGFNEEDIINSLNRILFIDYESLKRKAIAGKNFALTQKNNKTQTLKIINLLKQENK